MAVKLTGAEWNRFYVDPTVWAKDAWHEDEVITIDERPIDDDFDLSAVPETAKMTLSGGVVLRKGGFDSPSSLEEDFKRWRKRQTTAVLMVEVPHEAADAVRAAITSAGGRVIA